MKKRTKAFYLKEWLNIKPYRKAYKTDHYYLRIANEVKQSILQNRLCLVLLLYLDEEELDLLSCFLTSYFEDLISGSNIWNTFIEQCKKLYNKELPFYDLTDYYAGEINTQDLYFLIWYFMETIQHEKAFAPFNDFILETAKVVMPVFEKEWEYAPENELLREYYSFPEDENDFYQARNFMDQLLFHTYLFYPDTGLRLLKLEARIIEKVTDEEHVVHMLQENRDKLVHAGVTHLLAYSSKEWATALLGKNHPLYHSYLNMSRKITGYFQYKGQDEKNIVLEHIASGRIFSMTKKSFDNADRLNELDAILYLGIVMWQNEWWFSGIFAFIGYNADLLSQEKKSQQSKSAVDFLEHQDRDMDKILNRHYTIFKAYNQGSPIAFIPAREINAFTQSFFEFYTKSLDTSKKVIKKSRERFKKAGFTKEKNNELDLHPPDEYAVAFFNPRSGLEFALGVNSAFPDEENPHFMVSESEDDMMNLLISEEISPELVHYCLDHYRNKIPFFQKELGKLYLENLDFYLRFNKRKAYYSEPKISFF